MTFEKKRHTSKSFDNISITAFRILSILNALLKEPLSDIDINEKLKECIDGSRSLSNDSICIYINTLRSLGCEISRPSKNTGYKYVLKSHPFKLDLSLDEINTILEIRKYVSTLGNWKLSIEIDDLFNQLLNLISPESKSRFLSLKKTLLCREINIDSILPELNLIEKYCSQNNDLTLLYDSPNSGEKEICINAEKLTLENGSFYLWGYNYELNETLYLRLDRIKSIKLIKTRGLEKNKNGFNAIYRLTGASAESFIPSETEEIIENNGNDLVIKTKIKNKFKFIQNVLYCGSDCTVLSPESIRKEVICKLKMMSEVYNEVDLL